MRIARAVAVILAGASLLFAQSNKGRIVGTVTDKTGSVLAGAAVTVTNAGTNEAIRLTTSEAGTYSAPLLEPVTYRVTAEVAGFRKAVLADVKVDTAATVTANFTLEPGEVVTEVTVTGEPPLVNVEAGTLDQTIKIGRASCRERV